MAKDALQQQIYDHAKSGDLEALKEAVSQLKSNDGELNFFIETTYHEFSPLHVAIAYGHSDCVDTLLSEGADPNLLGENYAAQERNVTPLHLLGENSANNITNIASMLINAGADINAELHDAYNNQTVLSKIIAKSNSAAARHADDEKDIFDQAIISLIDMGADLKKGRDRQFHSPLDILLQHPEGYGKDVKSHLTSMIKKEITEGNHYRLHSAVYRGHSETVRFLCELGANPNTFDFSGSTPFSEAAKNHDENMVSLLQSFGGDIHAKDPEGNTVLHAAAHNMSYNMIESILDYPYGSLFDLATTEKGGRTVSDILHFQQAFLDKSGICLDDEEDKPLLDNLVSRLHAKNAPRLAGEGAETLYLNHLAHDQFKEFGATGIEGIAISLTQRYQRRTQRGTQPYHIYAVMDSDRESAVNGTEWGEFLYNVAALAELESPNPLRINAVFKCNGMGHWASCAIHIHGNEIKIGIIDSLPDSIYIEDSIDTIFKQFPHATVVLNQEKLQHGSLCCAIFAIDSVNHFSNWHEDFIEYMLQHEEVDEQKTATNGEIIHVCHLPPRLIRSMQSIDGLNGINEQKARFTEEELARPVNRKGETFLPSTEKFYIINSAGKQQNVRLSDHTLVTLREQALAFVMSHSPDELYAMIRPHTITGFKELVHEKQQEKAAAQEGIISIEDNLWAEKAKKPSGKGSGPGR